PSPTALSSLFPYTTLFRSQIAPQEDSSMATMVRWAPFSEVASLHNEMSRFMNGLLEGNGRTSQSWVPVADVWETENEVVYAFDLDRKSTRLNSSHDQISYA